MSRRRAWPHAQRAGHAEVHEQRPFTRAKQQIFAAAIDAVDRRPGDARLETGGNRPAQASVVHVHPDDPPTRHVRRDATPGRFDFGKLRHEKANARSSR